MLDQNNNLIHLKNELKQLNKAGHRNIMSKIKQRKIIRSRSFSALFDNGEYVEDALFANCEQTGLPADGVVTATGKIHGRTACVMANDSTVKLDHVDHAQLKRFYVFKKQLKTTCSVILFS